MSSVISACGLVGLGTVSDRLSRLIGSGDSLGYHLSLSLLYLSSGLGDSLGDSLEDSLRDRLGC